MWIKQGRIFHLGDAPNRSNHAQVPTPFVFDDFIRVYYACRNNGKAFVAYFDLAKDLKTVLKVHDQPIFTHGKSGMFDSDGVMPSTVVENEGELWMYYIGWNELKNTARYHNEIGIAVSIDGGETFHRKFEGPIMGRSKEEPGLAVMPFVYKGNFWSYRMWYQSLVSWELINGKYEPVYVIKFADSIKESYREDGVNWDRDPRVCLKPENNLEAFSRPTLIFKDNTYHMWVCVRDSVDYRGGKGSYRIHKAESTWGIEFDRRGIDLELGSEEEFDSNMQCYPYVLEVDGKLVMLYNGNDFGQTGIGVAIHED